MSNLDYDINLCMSVKNLKNNKNEQCPNKRKFGEYCGKHSNGKCKLRIDKFKNLEINKKKNTSSIKDIKNELNKFNLSIIGNKRELANKLYIFKQKIKYISDNHVDDIKKIQKFYLKYLYKKMFLLKGPGINFRNNCNNETDFYTMEDKNEIEFDYFFSFKDIDNFIYCFDIRSFQKLLEYNSTNPYNRNKIQDSVIFNFNELLRLKKILNIKLINVEQPKLSKLQLTKQKALSVFQKIDQLGFHTDFQWLMKLNIFQLKNFYKFAEDIWVFRANLDFSTKLKIIPDNNAFKISVYTIFNMYNYDKIFNIIINEIDRFVSLGITRDDNILGAMYMLTALTEVSTDCANAMPWLLQV